MTERLFALIFWLAVASLFITNVPNDTGQIASQRPVPGHVAARRVELPCVQPRMIYIGKQ